MSAKVIVCWPVDGGGRLRELVAELDRVPCVGEVVILPASMRALRLKVSAVRWDMYEDPETKEVGAYSYVLLEAEGAHG